MFRSLRPAARFACAAALLALACGCGEEERHPQWDSENDDLRRRLQQVGPVLGAAGWPVDLREIRIEYRTRTKGMEPAPRDWKQDLLLGFSDASRRHFARYILNVDPNRPLYPNVDGYYAPWRQAIVLYHSGYGELFSPDALIAHEAVHAYQHQARGSFTRSWQRGLRTIEQHAIQLCLTEGEADLGALAYVLRLRGESLTTDTGATARLAFEQGVTCWFDRVPYEVGLQFLLRGRDAGPRFGVDRQYATPPASTEQLLHPEKYGVDEPDHARWPTTSPPEGWKLESEDVLGEMEIYRWLAWRAGHDRAYLAATGWDADAGRVYRHAGHGRAAAWVSHWDRPDDARQFRDALIKHARCTVHHIGRTVLAFGAESEHAEELLDWLEKEVRDPPAIETDAEPTQRIEEAWTQRVKAPRLEKHAWRLPALGLSVPAPPGFNQVRYSGAYILQGPSETEWPPLIFIQVTLLGSPLSIDAAKERLTALEQGDQLTRVIEHRVLEGAGGGEALLVEHVVGVGGVWDPARLLSLIIPTVDGAVSVTARVHNRDRNAVWKGVESALERVDFTQLATRARR